MKATLKAIDTFLSSPKIAVAGVSRDSKKFGFQVFKLLKDSGVDVYPINPGADQIDGTPCFRSIGSLPADVNSLVILTPKKQTDAVVAEAITKGIGNIWIQQMCDTPGAIELARSSSINLVTGECLFMHTGPVKGIHKFHRNLKRFFGGMPK